jgi:hypothetical protein
MTCKPVRADVWPPKHPDATLDYAVSFEEDCARTWRPIADYGAGERIRLFSGGKCVGFEFEPTTPGRTGTRLPVFPSVVGATVDDGSLVWTCRALSNDSIIRTIVGTPSWSVEEDEITITGEAIADFQATAKLGGGEDDEDYDVTVTATTSDGLVIPKLVVLPVRKPVKVC